MNISRKKRKAAKRLSRLLVAGLLAYEGCVNLPGAGGRIGCIPPKTLLTKYLGEDVWNQQRGIAHTNLAGHIDIAHTRKYAELTQKYSKLALENISKRKSEFSFKSTEPVTYKVEISYPENFQGNKEAIAKDLGAYLSYVTSVMHETLTWFGWKSTLIVPEFSSLFSWEDRFSDTLGCYLGRQALEERGSFNRNLNHLLQTELDRLGVQSKEENIEAVNSVNGKWYLKGGLSGKMIARNFDIGLEDEKVSPSITPTNWCEEEMWDCPAPNLGYLRQQGFKVKVEVRSSAKKGKLKEVIGRSDFDFEEYIPKVMDYIRKDATRRGFLIIH